MYCIHCGEKNVVEAQYCKSCGKTVDKINKQEIAPTPPPTKPQKKRGNGIVIALVIVSIVGIGALALVALVVLISIDSEEYSPPRCDKDYTLKLAKSCTFLVTTDQGHGSGFAISPDYVVTNTHVIANASTIEAWLYDDYYEMTLWGFDENSDIAVLKSPKELTPCTWWDSEGLNPADQLYAVGWPNYPEGDSSVTQGVYSRTSDFEGIRVIQTDTPINPGNSGGPLLNNCGVVGVNVAKQSWVDDYTPAEGYSMAISGNQAQSVVKYLIDTGYPTWPPRTDY